MDQHVKIYLKIALKLSLIVLFITNQSIYAQDQEALEEVSIELRDSTRKSKLNAYPYVFYTPESKFAAGAGGIFVFYAGEDTITNPSKITFGGHYTMNKQYKITLDNEYYLLANKLYFSLPISYGYFVDKFWGIGEDTKTTGTESFEMITFSGTFTVQVPPVLFMADRTGLILEYNYTDIVSKDSNVYLLNDEVTGSNGGQFFGIGGDLVWDSRDNIFFPNSGGYQFLKFMIYPGIGDYRFGLFELDVKQFWSFKPDHVFAGNFVFEVASDGTPFYSMPALGGQNRMRGYYMGRYRDNVYMMLQLEYRQYFWKRLGLVVFGGAGNVADQLMTYSFQTLKYSLGGGLRFQFNRKEKINLRMDIGYGFDGSTAIYFGIEEAF